MKDYRKLISRKKIPAHVAIIMDGNGRWAKSKSLPRIEGHRRGAEILEPLMDAALDLGIEAVSLYAFSTENWRRPGTEVAGLWRLLDHFFTNKLDVIRAKGIRIVHSGFDSRLPRGTRESIRRSIDATSKNGKLVLNFCINYGGRQEIVKAVNDCLSAGRAVKSISEKDIERHLFTVGLPPVDLLIRTSGEHRISNFLIWQTAYSEMVFLDVLWPDFKPYHLYKSVYEFQHRERRFGGI